MLENTNLSGGEILKCNDIMRSEVKVVQTSIYRHLCNIKIASLSSNSSAGRKALAWGRTGWWVILRNNTSSHFHTKQNQVAQMSIHCDTDNIKRVMIKALAQAVFTISTISWREGEEQLRPGARVAQNSRLSPSFPLNTLDRIVWCNPLKGACLGHNTRQFLQPQGLF